MNDDAMPNLNIDVTPNDQPIENAHSLPNYEDEQQIENEQCLYDIQQSFPLKSPIKVFCKTPKLLLEIDENILNPMTNKTGQCTCRRKANQIWKTFFNDLNETCRCQLFVEMVKNNNYRPTMKTLGLRTSKANNEKSIVKNLINAYQSIGPTSRTKDGNTIRSVIASAIVSKSAKKYCLIRKTSSALKISRKTLLKTLGCCERIEDTNNNELWSFSDRLP